MLRRAPEAVVAAHVLDPERRELYVEGHEDRVFLLWIAGEHIDANSRVAQIDEVDLPEVTIGGNRARVLAFARLAEAEQADIRFLIDADDARLRGEVVPPNVWLTDLRDLEGYVLRGDCVGKVLALGVGVIELDAYDLVDRICALARRLGALRSLSAREALDFSFTRLNLARCSSATQEDVDVDFDHVLRTLMQNARMSLAEFEAVKGRWEAEERDLADVEDAMLVHGKDAFALLTELLLAHGVSRADAPRLLWTSFERGIGDEYPVLREVVAYLEAA